MSTALYEEIKKRTESSKRDEIQESAINNDLSPCQALESQFCPLDPASLLKALLSFLEFLSQSSFHYGNRETSLGESHSKS